MRSSTLFSEELCCVEEMDTIKQVFMWVLFKLYLRHHSVQQNNKTFVVNCCNALRRWTPSKMFSSEYHLYARQSGPKLSWGYKQTHRLLVGNICCQSSNPSHRPTVTTCLTETSEPSIGQPIILQCILSLRSLVMDNKITIHKLQNLMLEHYVKVEKRRTSLIEDQLRWKCNFSS